jgi:hypothetical protein
MLLRPPPMTNVPRDAAVMAAMSFMPAAVARHRAR